VKLNEDQNIHFPSLLQHTVVLRQNSFLSCSIKIEKLPARFIFPFFPAIFWDKMAGDLKFFVKMAAGPSLTHEQEDHAPPVALFDIRLPEKR
jgi:hypothetical protein